MAEIAVRDFCMYELILNAKITEVKTRDEQEVYGYYEASDIIIENATNIELTENYIKQLHSLLLNNTIRKDLQYLLVQNEIKVISVGKGTVYAAAKGGSK